MEASMRCEWCQQNFVQSRWWKRFCCTECQQAWHREQRKREQVQQAERRLATAQRIVTARFGEPEKVPERQALVTRR
jgi:hypothetical protein